MTHDGILRIQLCTVRSFSLQFARQLYSEHEKLYSFDSVPSVNTGRANLEKAEANLAAAKDTAVGAPVTTHGIRRSNFFKFARVLYSSLENCIASCENVLA